MTTNIHITVWGTNLICNGEIGNGTVFDGIVFNIDGQSCTISGSGEFNASRIRKNSTLNATTTLVIATNITLLWNQASNTQFYNNIASGAANFNLTINAGCTLNCQGSPGSPGNFSIDGINGTSTASAGGQISIFGTLNVAGILYATTNNTSTTNQVNMVVGSGGLLRVAQINSPASGTALSRITIQNGGNLELTGTGFPTGTANWSTTNNRYDFAVGSTVEFSAQGAQTIPTQSDFQSATAGNSQYYHLTVSGSGVKTIRAGLGTLTARGNLTIQSSAILDQDANDVDIHIGGNWSNYHSSAFVESTNILKQVRFFGNNFPIQDIFCPGGEQFQNLVIAKSMSASGAKVRMQSPVTVNNQLTLGLSSGNVTYGVLELNQNTLTLNRSDSAAIRLQGSSGYYRYILAEDSSFASLVRWNIGSSTGTYTIPFGISATEDTIPLELYKPNAGDIGMFTVSTYGTAADNLPWPTGIVNVNNLQSGLLANNIPDNRAWTVDRFWYLGATNYVAGISAGFRYNNRVGSTSELPTNDPNTLNLKAQYWNVAASGWMIPQLGQGTPSFTQPAGVSVLDLPVLNSVWTLSSVSSPLAPGPLDAVYSTQPINPFCSVGGSIDLSIIGGNPPYSYAWNTGATTQDLNSIFVPGTYTVSITDASADTLSLQVQVDTILPNQIGPIIGNSLISLGDTTQFSIPPVVGATSYLWEVQLDTGQGCTSCPYQGSYSIVGNGNDSIRLIFPPGTILPIPPLSLRVYSLGCWGDSVLNVPLLYTSTKPFRVSSPCSFPIQASISPVSCLGGNDGEIKLRSITEFENNGGLLISEIHTDPPLSDSPFEWVELIAYKSIDFTETPYTVIFSNNGIATSKGWTQGGIPTPPPSNSTYAFLIDSGEVTTGEVIYVGGAGMSPNTNRFRIIDTGTQPGDGGIGGAFVSSGVLGNGGGVADGIAVFDKHVSEIDSNTVPVDAVFFGSDIGAAAMSDTTRGFTLPLNDLYNGGRLKTNSYFAPEILGSYSLRSSGTYNRPNGTFSSPRNFSTNNQSWISPTSSITIIDYEYLWSNGVGSSSVSNLTPGNYTVMISDPLSGNACLSAFEVPLADQLEVQITFPPIVCHGGTTLANISAVGGWPPYNGTKDTLLFAGNHTFQVTDSKGCVITQSIQINEPPPLLITGTNPPILCFGDSIPLTISASGGVSPYAGIGVFSMKAGTRNFSVSDAGGCTVTYVKTLTEPAELVADASFVAISCGGDSTQVMVTASGGTSPYSGTGSFVEIAGSFTYIVTDSNGCKDTLAGTIPQPQPLILTVNAWDKYCAGSYSEASAAITGGNPPYQFLWSNGSTSASITNIGLGVYTVSVTDTSGCFTTASDTVSMLPDSLLLSINVTANPICPDTHVDSIVASITGGIAPFLYTWSTGNTGGSVNPIQAGTYTITVSDASQCSITDSITIEEYPKVIIASIQPLSTNQGLPVQLHGSGFNLVNSVVFDSISAAGYTITSDSMITALVPGNAPNGQIILTDTNGCITVSDSSFTYLTEFTDIYVRLFIEGVYAGSGFMNLPLVNSGIANDGISVDTIEAILYKPDNLTIPFERRKTVLKSNGIAEFTFPGYCMENAYWLAIRHRNSLETWSKQPVFMSQTTTYNFSGLTTAPTLTTNAPILLTDSSATIGGNIISDGGLTIFSRGICWDTVPNPTITSGQTIVLGSGIGSFTTTLSGLQIGKTVYLRAYATNITGSFYGQQELILIPINQPAILPAGSFLVQSGSTYNTGLKPYGMIYDLITNYQVPVYWCINPNKQRDSADFVHNGVAYRGGTFAINANYITPQVASAINSWRTNQGVAGNYSVAPFFPPVFDTISCFPKVIIDNSSNYTGIISSYFVNAGIPSTAYGIGMPSNLNGCHDLWTNPHDDPSWSTHSYLRNFVTINKGNIWAQCHLVSMLEACRNPTNTSIGLNFLTTSGLQCYTVGKCGAISTVHSSTWISPTTYHFPSSPIMQFLGKIDNLANKGSERWYIPAGQWNQETVRGITTGNGSAPGEGAILVYGPAYGNSANGMVMYQGGHDLTDGTGGTTVAERVAGQRVFFNYVLLSGIQKGLTCTKLMPYTMSSGSSSNFSTTITNGTGPYTYQWSASMGSFSNANSATCTFTAPIVQAQTTIEVRLALSDACGRVNFKIYYLTIYP